MSAISRIVYRSLVPRLGRKRLRCHNFERRRVMAFPKLTVGGVKRLIIRLESRDLADIKNSSAVSAAEKANIEIQINALVLRLRSLVNNLPDTKELEDDEW